MSALVDAISFSPGCALVGPLSPGGRETERGGVANAEGGVRSAGESVFHWPIRIGQSALVSPSPWPSPLKGEETQNDHFRQTVISGRACPSFNTLVVLSAQFSALSLIQ